MSGLSKNYRIAGFRAGWMVVSGAKSLAKNYKEALTMLGSLRLCANVPFQYAIQTALGGYQSINELIVNGGRLKSQRDIAYDKLSDIEGISCVKPMGAMYCYAKVDAKKFGITDDEKMALDILKREKILIVNCKAFNHHEGCYFRVVFLPHVVELSPALDRLRAFFDNYRQIP